MGLLTRDERKNLGKDERKALRQARRADRPKRGLKLNINWDGLLETAETLIMDIVDDQIGGPAKMDEVVLQLASEADGYLKWESLGVVGSFLEMVDGPVIQALFAAFFRPHIQRLYDRMRDEGRV